MPGVPHIAANVALGLLSSGLAAVLFLLVLLLVEGWRMPPISAAIVVTAMPAAALAAGPFERRVADARVRAAAGTMLGAGGVAGLGLLPGAGWAWTLAPQLLVGAGLALSLGALTEAALAGRSPAAIHGGVTIASRHAGVVLGLVLLTPVFVGDLDRQRERATQKGAELVLDARIDALTKVDLAARIASDIQREPGRLPDIHRSFAAVDASSREQPELHKLESRLDDQLDRAATSSFERSFLFAALLAILALVPIAADAAGGAVMPTRRTLATLACSAALAVSVPAAYVALGGGSYEPSSVRNPCAQRDWRDPGGVEAVAQQIALSALDGAACHFGVSRETLTLALATSSSRARFARQHNIDSHELENAVRRGLERSVDDAERAGAIGGLRATALRLRRRARARGGDGDAGRDGPVAGRPVLRL